MRCPDCHAVIKNKHPNRIRCHACAKAVRKQPNPTQKAEAQKNIMFRLAGKISRDDIAKQMGVSISDLRRLQRKYNVSLAYFNKFQNNPKLTQRILDYYATHTKDETQAKFPGISIRSAIEHYTHKPKQARWSNNDLLSCIRLLGLLKKKDIAQYLKRPNAYAGSITALIQKKIHTTTKLHFMPNFILSRINAKYKLRKFYYFKAALWHEIKYLGKDEVVASALKSLKLFQSWLYKSRKPVPKILKLMEVAQNGKKPVAQNKRPAVQYQKCCQNTRNTHDKGNREGMYRSKCHGRMSMR